MDMGDICSHPRTGSYLFSFFFWPGVGAEIRIRSPDDAWGLAASSALVGRYEIILRLFCDYFATAPAVPPMCCSNQTSVRTSATARVVRVRRLEGALVARSAPP